MEKSNNNNNIEKCTNEKVEDTVSIILNDKASTMKEDNGQQYTSESIFKKWWFKMVGDVYGDDDPHNLSSAKKNIIVFIVALSGLIGPASNFIYMPAINNVMNDMNTSLTGINATIAIYTVFLGIAPLFWAAMSDIYGRKKVYIISLIIYLLGAIVTPFSTNIGMFIFFRAVQACGGGAGQTIGAGVIADIFQVSERGTAYGFFNMGGLFGPIIGPSLGGALCEFLGWRSSFYFLCIFAIVLLTTIIFVLPETLRLEKLIKDERNQCSELFDKQKSDEEESKLLKMMRSVFLPMVVMVGDPTVILITIYNTVMFGSLFFINPTITDVFQTIYNYNSWQVGLCYLLIGGGLITGSLLSGRYSDYILRRLRETKGKDNVHPEMRLRAGFPSFILIPIGLIIYGWTTEKRVEVYGPFIGLYVFACGQMWGITPASVYLVDSKPGRSASALAINNFARYITAAIIAIFSTSSVRTLGTGVLYTIIAGINIANIALSLLVFVHGKRWRISFEKRSGTGHKQ